MHLLVYVNDILTAGDALRLVDRLATHFTISVDLLASENLIVDHPFHAISPEQTNRLPFTASGELAIWNACRTVHYDLVVVATEERRGLVRLIWGSRVGRMVHMAPASMWIVRQPASKVQHILLGVSGSPQMEHDVRLTAILAQVFGARVTLAHVVSQLPLTYVEEAPVHSRIQLKRYLDLPEVASVQLRKALQILAEYGVIAKVVLREGLVRDELLALCQPSGDSMPAVDLLVLGAHVRSAGAGMDYYEDIAEQVAQAAPISTLVVHTASDLSAWQSHSEL
jgi:nucleotide-binding universal stress UspA family protein